MTPNQPKRTRVSRNELSRGHVVVFIPHQQDRHHRHHHCHRCRHHRHRCCHHLSATTTITTTTTTTMMESGTKKIKKRSRAGRDKHRARGLAMGYVQAKVNEEQEKQLKAAQCEAAAAQAAAQPF
jgi:nitrous oxidase accessory protein NosD